MNLAALLFDGARRLPQRPAVSDDRNSWNYRELAERIAWIAGGFRARGLVPGDRVLLSLENCGEFFELLFAVGGPGSARCRPTRGCIHARSNTSPRIPARGCSWRLPASPTPLPRSKPRSPASNR